MSAVQDAIGDCVCDGGIAEVIVPLGDGNLAGDHRGTGAIAILDDLEEITSVLVPKGSHAPVVQDQQVDSSEPRQQFR